jgi:hypothetical protein
MLLNDYIKHGVPILYSGPEFTLVSPNWKSTQTFKKDVLASIEKDIALGRKSGPYTELPCPNFRSSPLGAFAKKHSTKVRFIHDLSWPPDRGVNAFIPTDLCSVSYISVDDAVREVKLRGRGALMSKIDLQDAYKSILVRPEDYHYLGSSWTDDAGNTVYYLDHVLPFGMRSSANLFDLFATGLEFAMHLHGCTNVIHYLDDYFTCGSPASLECKSNLDIMLSMCDLLGIPSNPSKTVQPTTELEFLGIVISSTKMNLTMSDQRLEDIIEELLFWRTKGIGPKRKLLSLLGKLVFLCRMVQPGRIFTRRLFTASAKVKLLYHRVKLSSESMKDIDWWLSFIKIWNGTSVFLEHNWTLSSVLTFAADASNLGMGAVYLNHWWSAPFNSAHLKFPIAWRELFAILVECRTWGHAWTSKHILIECDNLAIVHSMNNGTSKNCDIMSLIQDIFFLGSYFCFDVRLKHLPGLLNIGPDLLSRLKIPEFAATFPAANKDPTPIPATHLLPTYKLHSHVAHPRPVPRAHAPPTDPPAHLHPNTRSKLD